MLDRPAAAVVVENFAMGGIGDVNRRRAIDGLRLAPTPRIIGVAGRQACRARRDEPAFSATNTFDRIFLSGRLGPSSLGPSLDLALHR
jgi:hypothetical protein